MSSNFRVDIYDANLQLIVPSWVFTGSNGTTNFTSNPFVNTNSTDSDFYIRAWSYNWPIYDFTLNIDEYVASNNVNNPKPVAPDVAEARLQIARSIIFQQVSTRTFLRVGIRSFGAKSTGQ
ncbi:MAG TPA: hypothetical protein VJ023_09170 [Pyrinomonadaceae bacterium]|nr:hypothetical protein [Pyrinomonadaceae bacterium]